MRTKLPLLLFVLMISMVLSASAQDAVDMADVMRSNGKIYVVVAVAAIVMIGILVYLAVLDRKISAMEKKVKEKS
jgi:CcmD family protein